MKRERELLREKNPNERKGEGRMGAGWGARGARGAPSRAGLGRVWLGWVAGWDGSPQHTRPLIENQLRIEIRNEAIQTRD
jgi:hypothetical protein